MGRAPCLIANYLSREGKTHDQLNKALQNLGRATSSEDKEFHAVMKQLNDGKPLRGFARELVQSKDGALAKRAAEAVLVAGDEGKLLVDEAGQACNKEGDAVELNEEEDDKNLKALETLSHELSEHNSLVKGQLRELHKIVEQLATGNGTMGVAGPKTAVDSRQLLQRVRKKQVMKA